MMHVDVARSDEVLFAPRGVFCIAASRLPLRCHPPEAAMAVVAGWPGDGGVGGVGAEAEADVAAARMIKVVLQ